MGGSPADLLQPTENLPSADTKEEQELSADEGSIPGLSELLQGSVLGHVEDLFDHDDASVPSLLQGTGDGDRAALADCMLISSNMHRPVELRLTDRGPGSEPPVTVVQLFQQAVERHAAKRALCVKRAGEWKTWTYQKYYDDSVALARAFIKVSVVRSSPCTYGVPLHVSSVLDL